MRVEEIFKSLSEKPSSSHADSIEWDYMFSQNKAKWEKAMDQKCLWALHHENIFLHYFLSHCYNSGSLQIPFFILSLPCTFHLKILHILYLV